MKVEPQFWFALAAMVALPGGAGAQSEPATPAASVVPSSTSSPVARKLEVIGHVRARTAYCTQLETHLNDAIDAALHNDARMAITVTTLRGTKFDDSVIAKRNGTVDLVNAYADLEASAARARAALKKLKTDASNAPTADQKAEVTQVADALSGAVQRQHNVAKGLASYIGYLETHQGVDEWQADENLEEVMRQQGHFGSQLYGDPRQWTPYTLSELAKGAADRFVETEQSVTVDEGTAAVHLQPAVGNC